MIRISDKELVEGFLGSIGWVGFFFYLRLKLKWPTPMEGFLAWSLVWLLRKIGMHAYLEIKKQNKIKERIFNII